MSVANEDDNLSLCGILAKLYLVAESVCVFRPSITVLREGSKGFVGGLFFRRSVELIVNGFRISVENVFSLEGCD